jgi:hypothetical protein
LLHSSHNKGTVFNNGCQDDVMMNVDVSFFHCILLCQ